jgi:hypothetical protein
MGKSARDQADVPRWRNFCAFDAISRACKKTAMAAIGPGLRLHRAADRVSLVGTEIQAHT